MRANRVFTCTMMFGLAVLFGATLDEGTDGHRSGKAKLCCLVVCAMHRRVNPYSKLLRSTPW